MTKRTVQLVWLLVAVLAVPTLSSSQSLGSVAKKERERRQKNKEKGVVSREYTEKEVVGDKDEEGDKIEADQGEEPGEAAPGVDGSPSVLPDPIDPTSKVDSRDLEQESRERHRDEVEWRARMQRARENVSAAREQVRVLSELYLAQGERYVDENGRTVVSSPAQLQRLTQRAKERLAAAEKALDDLQEEARRAGVPPGWLR